MNGVTKSLSYLSVNSAQFDEREGRQRNGSSFAVSETKSNGKGNNNNDSDKGKNPCTNQ